MAIVDKRNRSRADAHNPTQSRRPIGQDFSNAQVELGRVPQINSSAFGAPGRGVSQVGNAVGDLLKGVEARAEKDAEFAASKAYAEYQNGVTQDFVDHENGALPDGTDHTLNWSPKHQKRVDEFRSKVDDKRFQKYEANLVRNGGKFKLKAGEFETKRRYEYQSSELTKYLTPQLKILKAHPTEEGLATTREVSHNMVNSMDLTPEQKEQMKAKLDDQLSLTRLEGLTELDPQKAISEIDSQLNTLENAVPQTKKVDGSFKGAPDYRGKKAAAAIRYNNPGAQWPGKSAKKFGMTHSVTLKDGQNNKIAVFPTMIHGAAAQFDLLNRAYTGKTLASAIKKWSGGNNWQSYVAGITKRTGIKPNTIITKEMMKNPEFAITLTKAMSQHEAAKKGIMSDQNWKQAHQFFLSGGKGGYAPQGIDQSQEGYKAQLGQMRVRAEKQLIKHQERQQENQMMQGVLTGQIKVSPYDSAFMSDYNKAFNNRFSAGLNLLGNTPEAQLGLQIAKVKAPFPKRIMQSLQGSMESPEPETQLKAYQYADKLERANPAGFKAGTNGEKLGDKLAWFRRNAEFGGGINAIQRMNAMNERSAKMNKEQIKAEGVKLSKDLDENTHFESVFETEVLGWNADLPVTKRLQAQMMSEYKQLVMEGFSVHANADRAKAEAMRNISKIYGASEIDGTRRIMKYPPEGFIAPTDLEHVQEQLGEARQEAVTRAKPLIDAWRKQGWVPDGEPVIVSDEYTRRQADAWSQGATHEESVVMFPGTSAPMKTRSLPTWRFAIPVTREDGTKAVFMLDDRFAVDGLEQRKFDNDESVRARAKARFELKSEGELNQYYPHNIMRRAFKYENTEVQKRIDENNPFKSLQ